MTLKELREYHEAQANLFRAKQRAYGVRPSYKLWREMQAMHERAARLLSEWLPKAANPKEPPVPIQPDWPFRAAVELYCLWRGNVTPPTPNEIEQIIKRHHDK